MKRIMPLAALAALSAAMPRAIIGSVRGDAGDVASQLAAVNAKLTEITSEVKKTAEDALKQANQNGQLTAETKAAADKLLTDYNGLNQKQTELTTKLEQLETKNRDLEQSVAAGGGQGRHAPSSLGEMVVNSEAFKKRGSIGQNAHIKIDVKNAITTASGSGGGLIFATPETTPVRMPRRTLSVMSLITMGRTDSNMISYTRQTTRTNGAAPVAEEAAAPQSSYGWTKAEAAVRKFAHVTHISEETLADAAMLQSELDSEMRYGLDLVLESQIVAGDGTGQNLHGIRPLAPTFVAAAGLPNVTRIDRLRLGMLQLTLANYSGDGILLHDTDWAAIELQKDSTNQYMYGNPGAAFGTPRIWNLDIATTLAQSAGEWVVGNFMLAATYYDRAETEILISSEHGTNFVDGMLTMKGSRRGALAVKRPAAMVKGDFTFV